MHTRIFLALSFLVAFPLWAVAAESSSADQLHLAVEQGKITVKAKNVPARQFFEELEIKSTIPINYLGKADERLSADIIDCPLATGLSLITRNFNHSIIYNDTESETGVGISALFIFSKEKEGGITYTTTPEHEETSREQHGSHLPQFHESPGGIAVHALTPLEADPLLSLRALDPLVRFDDGRPIFDPVGWRQDQEAPRIDELPPVATTY